MCNKIGVHFHHVRMLSRIKYIPVIHGSHSVRASHKGDLIPLFCGHIHELWNSEVYFGDFEWVAPKI